MFSLYQTILEFILTTLFFLILGLPLLIVIQPGFLKTLEKLSVCMLSGIAIIVIMCTGLALFNMLKTSIFLMVLILFFAVTFILGRKNVKLRIHDISFKYRGEGFYTLTFFICVVFSMAIFIRYAFVLEVSPPIDSIVHGMFTSLIMYKEGFFSDFSPVVEIGEMLSWSWFSYMQGFHTVSALISMLFDTQPCHSMLIIASVICALIPLLFYTFIKHKTQSILLSLIAFLFPFIVPSSDFPLWRPSFNLLVGSYIVGAYPYMLGCFLFIGLIILSEDFITMMDKICYKRAVFLGILFFALFLSYYPFAILMVAIYLLIYIYKSRKNRRKLVATITLLILIYFLIKFTMIEKIMLSFFSIDSVEVYRTYKFYDIFSLNSIYWWYLPIMLIGFFSSALLLRRKIGMVIPICVMLMTMLQLLSLDYNLYSIFCLWVYRPQRNLILTINLSFLCIVILIAHSSLIEKMKMIRKRMKFYRFLWLTLLITISIIFLPHIQSHLTWSPETYGKTAWVLRPTGEMFEGLNWIAKNIEAGKIILNDPAMPGVYLETFYPPKSIVNEIQTAKMLKVFRKFENTCYEEMIDEANKIFIEPKNYSRVLVLYNKYSIRYILLVNVPPESRAIGIWAHNVKIIPSTPTLTFQQYKTIFNNNPYLKIVYENSALILYQIFPPDLKE
jgi:hypothetical protein